MAYIIIAISLLINLPAFSQPSALKTLIAPTHNYVKLKINLYNQPPQNCVSKPCIITEKKVDTTDPFDSYQICYLKKSDLADGVTLEQAQGSGGKSLANLVGDGSRSICGIQEFLGAHGLPNSKEDKKCKTIVSAPEYASEDLKKKSGLIDALVLSVKTNTSPGTTGPEMVETKFFDDDGMITLISTYFSILTDNLEPGKPISKSNLKDPSSLVVSVSKISAIEKALDVQFKYLDFHKQPTDETQKLKDVLAKMKASGKIKLDDLTGNFGKFLEKQKFSEDAAFKYHTVSENNSGLAGKQTLCGRAREQYDSIPKELLDHPLNNYNFCSYDFMTLENLNKNAPSSFCKDIKFEVDEGTDNVLEPSKGTSANAI